MYYSTQNTLLQKFSAENCSETSRIVENNFAGYTQLTGCVVRGPRALQC